MPETPWIMNRNSKMRKVELKWTVESTELELELESNAETWRPECRRRRLQNRTSGAKFKFEFSRQNVVGWREILEATVG
jgi:hypothetical protein